ncbi:MAG: hypothetical protein ACOYIR_04530 [Christensenellales bacterium]
MNKTTIIAIEGIDGSGKTLQLELLQKQLETCGYSVSAKSFPEYGSFFGKQIGALLKGDTLRADQIDSKSMCLWYALDRWQSFRDYVDGAVDYLLLNRFTPSNAVYQSVRAIDDGLPDIWDWVHELEQGTLGLPEPDCYVLLDVDPSLAQRNVDKKGTRDYISAGERDVYEAQAGLLLRARARYLSIARRQSNFAVIPCMEEERLLSPEAVFERVWVELKRRGLVRP